MKQKILSALQQTDNYLSGEALSAQLGITRSAVWKHIRALKTEGYDIDSVTNRGYRLVNKPDLLQYDAIISRLHTHTIGTKLLLFRTIDSTNDELKRQAREGAPGGLVTAAEVQTAGRGRFQRSWSSGADGGLYFSFMLRPELPPADMAPITLAAGYAVCLAIREYTGIDARIKWPNDIIAGSRKLCGILTEMAAQSDRIDYLITGIGINVNNEHFPEELRSKATSLKIESGKAFDRSDFLVFVLQKLDLIIGQFPEAISPDNIEHFKSLCATIGRRVTVQKGSAVITGTACDLSPSGDLIVQSDDGQRVLVNSGEVTVQGIY